MSSHFADPRPFLKPDLPIGCNSNKELNLCLTCLRGMECCCFTNTCVYMWQLTGSSNLKLVLR